jgi:hypothetical protein
MRKKSSLPKPSLPPRRPLLRLRSSSRPSQFRETTPDTRLSDRTRPEEEPVEEEETETSRELLIVEREDLPDRPEAVVDKMEKAEERDVNPESPELMMVNAATVWEKVTSPRTAPNPRRRELPVRRDPLPKVAEAEEEVRDVSVSLEKQRPTMANAVTVVVKVTSPRIAPSPRRKELPVRRDPLVTTNAATATRKVTSPETVPNPRRSAPRDLDVPSLLVPPLVRPAETATRKDITLEIAPPKRRKELPVSKDPRENPDLATTAVKKDISPETALKPRLPKKAKRERLLLVRRERPDPSRKKTSSTIRMVSTVRISPPGKPSRPLTRTLEPPRLFRSPRRTTPPLTRSTSLPLTLLSPVTPCTPSRLTRLKVLTSASTGTLTSMTTTRRSAPDVEEEVAEVAAEEEAVPVTDRDSRDLLVEEANSMPSLTAISLPYDRSWLTLRASRQEEQEAWLNARYFDEAIIENSSTLPPFTFMYSQNCSFNYTNYALGVWGFGGFGV